MKEAKVIHINDGTSVELTNGNRHYAEEQTWAGRMLTMYLNAGYKIINIIPDFTPSMEGEGGYNLYKTGFTAFMIRELTDDSAEITPDDWERENIPEKLYTYEDYADMFMNYDEFSDDEFVFCDEE